MWWIRDIVAVLLFMIEGIYKAFTESKDFLRWEQAIYQVIQEAMRWLLQMACERLDEELMRQREHRSLKVVHRKPRTLLTPFGEIQFTRRYYRDEQTGEGRFLLDEAMGLGPRQRLSPWCQELAVL